MGLFKKAKKAVSKVVKSPVGKVAIAAGLAYATGGFGATALAGEGAAALGGVALAEEASALGLAGFYGGAGSAAAGAALSGAALAEEAAALGVGNLYAGATPAGISFSEFAGFARQGASAVNTARSLASAFGVSAPGSAGAAPPIGIPPGGLSVNFPDNYFGGGSPMQKAPGVAAPDARQPTATPGILDTLMTPVNLPLVVAALVVVTAALYLASRKS